MIHQKIILLIHWFDLNLWHDKVNLWIRSLAVCLFGWVWLYYNVCFLLNESNLCYCNWIACNTIKWFSKDPRGCRKKPKCKFCYVEVIYLFLKENNIYYCIIDINGIWGVLQMIGRLWGANVAWISNLWLWMSV
jgi:hypothetical protein